MDKVSYKHLKLREILSKYGDEFGDVIVDEICDLFNYPNTIDLEILIWKNRCFK